MKSNIYKIRFLLAIHRRTILSVCTLLIILSVLGAAFTFVNPPSTTVTDVTSEETITSSVSTEATVDQNSSLYTEGETLQNSPLYFYQTVPEVDILVETTTPPSSDVTGTQTLLLQYQATTQDREQFWEDERTIGNTRINGEQVTHRTSLDMNNVRNRIENLESETGGNARVTVQLLLKVEYQIDEDNGTITEIQPVTLSQNSYSIPSFTGTGVHQETEDNKRPIPSEVTTIAVPGIGNILIPYRTIWFLLLAGATTLIGAATFKARDIDPEVEKTAIHKTRYQEWISPGQVPTDTSHVILTVESLAELVNVAIDSEKRVIYDRTQRCYVVVDGFTMYVYLEAA